MARAVCAVTLLLLIAASFTSVRAQTGLGEESATPAPVGPTLPAALPPVTPGSPMDSILFADRGPGIEPPPSDPDGSVFPVQHTIPGDGDGTGTGFPEVLYYQLPSNYSPQGPAHPLVVAYHGFGSSAQSVHQQSSLDEEADTNGWIYMAVTGLDDQLFGPPLSQVNTEAAIQWVIDGFNVDEDRIYMVGFSMGAGVTANFAARHRDPDGIMIAGIGMVAGAWDYTQTYNTGTAGLQTLMQNPFNFVGPPSTQPFNYKQASTLYFDPATYPALPGSLVLDQCMGLNLASVPAYMVWDRNDPVTLVQPQNPVMVQYLESIGATVDDHELDPPIQLPNPHSWTILDETQLFAFLSPFSVERYPADFTARLDVSAAVSYVDVTMRRIDDFANLTASADAQTGTVTLSDVDNVKWMDVDMAAAGISGVWPVRVTATSADADGFELRLTGFDQSPSYLLDAVGDTLITGVDSDPLTGTLIVSVPGNSTLDVNVIHEPTWIDMLWTDPQPAQVGGLIDFNIDAPDDGNHVIAYVVLSVFEQLTPFWGDTSVVTVNVAPPAIIFAVPLDIDGDFSLTDAIPNDPTFSGVRIVLQAVSFDALGELAGVTNLWGLRVQ